MIRISLLPPPCSARTCQMSNTKPVVSTSDGSGYVHASGRRLYLDCAGHRAPTVILEAGAGRAHDTWDAVWSALTTLTRVCRYDRAGIGHSQSGPRPRTVQDVVTDLHALLHAAQLPRPYLLVGHSLGGLIVRLYAGLHPEEVVGLVLIDSSHPDQLDLLQLSGVSKHLIATQSSHFIHLDEPEFVVEAIRSAIAAD